MSREIKFRAWSPKYEKFLKPYKYPFGHDDLLLDIENGKLTIMLDEDQAKYCDDVILEQFTGLKDKNGVDIYEGDIVSVWGDGYNHKGDVRWRFEGQPAIIIFPAFANQGFWKLHGGIGNGDAFTDNKTDDGVEVIGNIHENLELLINQAQV